MRRLETRGYKHKLVPVFKINALRILMTGKAKEGDRDTTDAEKSYEELLNEVKDYAWKRKLDTTAQKNMLHGGDPMDVGAAKERRAKEREDSMCYNCGEFGHPAKQ
jgi:hypothetical protein